MKKFLSRSAGLALAGLFLMPALSAKAAIYQDPLLPGTINVTSGSVALANGPLATGSVTINYWVTQRPLDPGYYYSYQINNVNASSAASGNPPANLTFFDIAGVAPFEMTGLGAGKGNGAAFIPWTYNGDDTSVASWIGTKNALMNSSIAPGSSSPAPMEQLPMFQIYSQYAPGTTRASVTTVSGGGYTGQSLSLVAPVVPEPSAMIALGTGLLSLGSIMRRKRA